MKKYNYQEFKNDPRTYGKNGELPRYIQALFDCIDNNQTSIETIFSLIDIRYSQGKHRSPSYIKSIKKETIKLLEKLIF